MCLHIRKRVIDDDAMSLETYYYMFLAIRLLFIFRTIISTGNYFYTHLNKTKKSSSSSSSFFLLFLIISLSVTAVNINLNHSSINSGSLFGSSFILNPYSSSLSAFFFIFLLFIYLLLSEKNFEFFFKSSRGVVI